MTYRSKTGLREYRLAIAALMALLLLMVIVTPASASPLTISGVAAGNVTDTSATITWTTDELADSVVNYGNTTALGVGASDASLVTGHSVPLIGLDPEMTYYYEVQSTNQAGNVTVTDNNSGSYYTFTTFISPPPVITGVRAVPTTETSAVVTWTTDKPATSVVNYGNTTPPTERVEDFSLVISHSLPLSGLQPQMTYYFEVQSTEETGNSTATDNNGGAYYMLRIHRLTGWGWSTDYTEIATAEFLANGILIPRVYAPGSSDLHLAGNVTLTLSGNTTETIDLDMYGTKVRSLFSSRQEEEGKSASYRGVWLTGGDGQYLSAWGRIILPQGEVFKTAEVYLLKLKTPDVEIPDRQPGGFVEDLEYFIAVFTKFIDGLIDDLMSTNFADIIAGILGKIMVLVAEVREKGIPYIP